MAAPGVRDLAEIRRALREVTARRRRAEQAERARIVPVPRSGRLAVSGQQRSLWFVTQLAPGSPAGNVPWAFRLRGALDVPALAAALHGVVARHESLRTRFGSEHGVPFQVVEPTPDAWPLPVRHGDAASVRRWIDEEAARPFDLANGPVFRSSLWRVTADDHVLVLVWHHVAADAWSARWITDDLAALYTAAHRGTAASLPDLLVQPADHAAWQRRWLLGGEAAAQTDHWRQVLDGAEPLELPSDRPRPARPTGAAAILETALPGALAAGLRDLARQEDVSLLSVLLAGVQVVLGRHTGQHELTVGSILPGRTTAVTERMVGCLATTVAIRGSLAGNPTFRTLVRRCDQALGDAVTGQDVAFDPAGETLRPDRHPLFPLVVTLVPASMLPRLRLPDVRVERVAAHPGASRFDLAVQAGDDPDGDLSVRVAHSTALYDRDRVERLVEHVRTVLSEAVGAPDAPVGSLEVLPPAERHRVLAGWNPPPGVPDGRLLHQLFTERATEAPDRVAMRFAGADLRYGDLHTRSNQLARLLTDELAVGPGRIVAVLLERGFDLPVAQLGVLKAGGAWLPLDPQYPAERLAYQLRDAAVAAVVTTSDLADRLPAGTARVLLDSDVLSGRPDTAPAVDVDPEDVAYVIYTSGSTGAPKGVLVPHRAAVNFCTTFREMFAVTRDDRILQFSNPAFDVSVSDFFSTFTAGATVVGAPRATLLDPDGLQRLLAEERVTMVDIPPAVLGLLDPEPLTELRVLFIGMEPFGAELVNRWSRPGREFHNGYGPTEATITCVDYRCPPEPLEGPPPIGRAMANQRAYVLDPQLRPAPIGVPGELYMAGAGLAHGYLGRPDLTAEKFLPDPYAPRPGERMYATGDLARWRADGNLEFLGRVDRQVKLRGLRVELGEVEHVLASHPGVRQTAVVVKDPGTAQARLVGYLVPRPGRQVDADQVRAYATDRLPLHMVPAALVVLDALPLTATGKLDHTRLPDPDPPAAPGDAAHTTDTERGLAGIWEDLLGLDAGRVGAGDNFFALGGSSLQATQLLTRIRERFGVTLDLRELFTHPTVDQLATRVDSRGRQPGRAPEPGSPVVAVKPDGSRPPLFLVHAVAGSVTPYLPLAALLGADQPCYALEDPGLHGEAPTRPLPETAASYLTAVRAVQPAGPYHLGGWSLGGAVALEMARQLRAGGEDVALVVALDTDIPATADQPDDAELLSWFVRDLAGLARVQAPPVDVAALRRLPADAQLDAALDALGKAGLDSGWEHADLRRRMGVFVTNTRAFLAYRPGRYPGRVVLLTAAEQTRGRADAGSDDDLARWRAVAAGGLEHHVVPGNHYTMLQPPHLSTLAEVLRRCLPNTAAGTADRREEGVR